MEICFQPNINYETWMSNVNQLFQFIASIQSDKINHTTIDIDKPNRPAVICYKFE